MSTLIRERLKGQSHDLGDGLMIRRVLPTPSGHAIGPFIFMDHFGPLTLPATKPMDVRPHPHIGLATVTYLWQGRIEHKDALGNTQVIEPGAVNWMTAGRGIVHSERTAAEDRGHAQSLHGLQLWVALPLEHERIAPSFEHTDASALPELSVDGASVRVIAGTAYGARSPVSTLSKLFYVDARMPKGKALHVPDEHVQRAAYLLEGDMRVDGESLQLGELMVFRPGAKIALGASVDSHVVLLGGAPLDAPRYLWWNFVASSEAALEEARQAWREQRYAMVEGDAEFIPLPDDGRLTLRLEAG
ncbi:MAG TPA: pirin family protein [Dokdonella sp.]|uniref:pirin family protein n=1 Tax=Dokdonella sp. TaxID=2291710 RepID=UPI002D7F27BD|nr:pirin family protein [Dokdonella sp.]HET9032842.1 pirin family protein [Dokdonella sp.]